MILAATIVDRRPYPIADRHPPIAHASILRRHGSVRKRRGIAQSGQLQCPPGIVLQRGTGDLNFESKALISRLTVTPGLARDMRSEASTDAAAHAAFPSMVGCFTAAPILCLLPQSLDRLPAAGASDSRLSVVCAANRIRQVVVERPRPLPSR